MTNNKGVQPSFWNTLIICYNHMLWTHITHPCFALFRSVILYSAIWYKYIPLWAYELNSFSIHFLWSPELSWYQSTRIFWSIFSAFKHEDDFSFLFIPCIWSIITVAASISTQTPIHSPFQPSQEPNHALFIRLNKTNYILWHSQMENAIHGNGFEEFVEGVEAMPF